MKQTRWGELQGANKLYLMLHTVNRDFRMHLIKMGIDDASHCNGVFFPVTVPGKVTTETSVHKPPFFKSEQKQSRTWVLPPTAYQPSGFPLSQAGSRPSPEISLGTEREA